nr:hypothetical protein [Vibrio aphrogenes]
MDEKSDWYILNKNRIYKDIAQNYFLFSESGSGDFYGFEIKDGECLSQVNFYDHECHSWNKTQYSNIFEYLEKYALMNGE